MFFERIFSTYERSILWATLSAMPASIWCSRNWLELTEDRKIVIVDPGRKSLPAYFAHLAPQITVRQQTAGQFFTDFRSTPLTTAQTSEQEARAPRRKEFEQTAAKKW